MADIDVRRRGLSFWPWILGLALLALIVWLLASQWGRDDRAADFGDRPAAESALPGPEPAPAAVEPAALEQFAQECAGTNAARQAGADHDYAVNCLRQLAAALEETARQQDVGLGAVQAQTQEIRDHARQLEQLPPESLEHSNHARLGAMAAVAALRTLDQSPATPDAGEQIGRVERTAQAIVARQLLLDQTQDVERFFQQAHAALRTLSRAPDRS
jgi:hypothetical protein